MGKKIELSGGMYTEPTKISSSALSTFLFILRQRTSYSTICICGEIECLTKTTMSPDLLDVFCFLTLDKCMYSYLIQLGQDHQALLLDKLKYCYSKHIFTKFWD